MSYYDDEAFTVILSDCPSIVWTFTPSRKMAGFLPNLSEFVWFACI